MKSCHAYRRRGLVEEAKDGRGIKKACFEQAFNAGYKN